MLSALALTANNAQKVSITPPTSSCGPPTSSYLFLNSYIDETKSAATHKDDIHRSFYKCSKCSKEKRSDYISSRDPVVVCKVCAKKEEPKKKEPKKKAPATKKRQRSPSSSLSSVTDNDDDGDMIKQQPPRLSQSVLDKLPEKTGVEEQDIVMDE